MSDFDTILGWILTHEGGYVNSKHDPGGATNKGVTQRVYDGFRKRHEQPKQGVKSITDDEVEAIYRRQYWDAIHGDDLPDGLNYAVFDFAVNSGPSRAAKFLQRRLGVKDDGVIGNITMAALQAAADKRALIVGICEDRLAWMKTLRTWEHFGRGWSRRVMGEHDGVQVADNGVVDRAVKLWSGEAVSAPLKTEQGEGKAEQADEKLATSVLKVAASKEGAATLAAAAGVIGTISDMPPVLQYALAAVIVIGAGAVAVSWVMGRRAEV